MSEKTILGLYDEIVKIRQLLEIVVKDNLKKELEKILTTKERQYVWALSDGEIDTKTMADKIGMTQRSVQRTIESLQNVDFVIVEKRGYPKRKFDYVPPEWKMNMEKKVKKPEQGTTDTQRNL